MECQHFRAKRRNRRSLPAKGYKDVSAFIQVYKKQNTYSSYGSGSGLQEKYAIWAPFFSKFV
jgi:hypothetical protein